MGNTNIPQFGAAGADNSRDTRTGTDQLTDEQRKQAGKNDHTTQPPPDTVPAPGQSRDTAHQEELRRSGEDEDGRRDEGGAGADRSAYQGHHNTGHSPSDAT